MRSFAELQSELKTIPVADFSNPPSVMGRLHLAGGETHVDLDSKQYLGRVSTESGLFDLHLQAGEARRVLLKNALVRSTSDHLVRGGFWQHQLYANTILLGHQSLSSVSRIKRISFTIECFESFFDYHFLETHEVRDRKSETTDLLASLRDDTSRTYQVRLPAEDLGEAEIVRVNFVHQLQSAFSFEVEGLKYEIEMIRTSGGGNFGSLNIQTVPIASIEFKDAVDIEDALSTVFSWKRFFSQTAFHELLLDSVNGELDAADVASADFYLPNELEKAEKRAKRPIFEVWQAPLANWSERGSLKEVMQNWISAEEELSRFRFFVGKVLSEKEAGYNFDHLMNLCAAIDAVPDLKRGPEMNEKLIAKMSKAAHDVAPQYPLKRLTGLFNSMNNTALRDKIAKMAELTLEPIWQSKIETLSRNISRLRKIPAHGHASAPLNYRLLQPVCQALLGLCILYDQRRAGLVLEGEMSKCYQPLRKFEWAMANLPDSTG